MKKTKLLCVIYFLANQIFAQTFPIDKSFSTEIIGFNRVQQKQIQAKVFDFDDRINQIEVDSLSGIVTLQLRGLAKNGIWLDNKGSFLALDYRKNTLIWKQKNQLSHGAS